MKSVYGCLEGDSYFHSIFLIKRIKYLYKDFENKVLYL